MDINEARLCKAQSSSSTTNYEVFKFSNFDTFCNNANGKIRRGQCCPNMSPKSSSKVRLSSVNPPICDCAYPNDPDLDKLCHPLYPGYGDGGKISRCDVQMEYGNSWCGDNSSTFCCLISQFNLYIPGLIVLAMAAAVVVFRLSKETLGGYLPLWEATSESFY